MSILTSVFQRVLLKGLWREAESRADGVPGVTHLGDGGKLGLWAKNIRLSGVMEYLSGGERDECGTLQMLLGHREGRVFLFTDLLVLALVKLFFSSLT